MDGVETPGMSRLSNRMFDLRHPLTQGIEDSQFIWSGAGTDWLSIAGEFCA
mgnify:CR=1 FL=1